jgi:hypothetical protein
LTLSISLHLLMMILLSSIVSCFLMITSSTRFFHSIRTNHSMCSFVVDKFETCRKKEGEREREWVSEWERHLLLSLHTLTAWSWFATYGLSYSLIFFNENNENASKINIILPLYVSAYDLLLIAKIFYWLVAHLCIHLIKFIQYSLLLKFEKKKKID